MHRRSLPATLGVLALATAACAGSGSGPGAPSPADAPLTYADPVPAPARFHQADSLRVTVDAGGQTFDVRQTQTATLALRFAGGESGLEVTADFVEFEGRVDNPMAGPQRFSVDQIEGPLVWTLDRRGAAVLVAEPVLSGGAEALVVPEAMAATFFPRLPDRAVRPGDAWTDSLSLDTETSNGVVRLHSVIEYTVRGDTVVDGNPLLKVDFVSDDRRMIEAREAGMDITQDLGGTGRGHFLWDRAANRLHSQVVEVRYTGTMEVPMAPFPLGLTVDGVSRTVAAGGG